MAIAEHGQTLVDSTRYSTSTRNRTMMAALTTLLGLAASSRDASGWPARIIDKQSRLPAGFHDLYLQVMPDGTVLEVMPRVRHGQKTRRYGDLYEHGRRGVSGGSPKIAYVVLDLDARKVALLLTERTTVDCMRQRVRKWLWNENVLLPSSKLVPPPPPPSRHDMVEVDEHKSTSLELRVARLLKQLAEIAREAPCGPAQQVLEPSAAGGWWVKWLLLLLLCCCCRHQLMPSPAVADAGEPSSSAPAADDEGE